MNEPTPIPLTGAEEPADDLLMPLAVPPAAAAKRATRSEAASEAPAEAVAEPQALELPAAEPAVAPAEAAAPENEVSPPAHTAPQEFKSEEAPVATAEETSPAIEAPPVADLELEAHPAAPEPMAPPPAPTPAAPPPPSIAAPADERPVVGTAEDVAPPAANIGVLLVNLGTPEAAEPKAVRAYLQEFLTDRRVIEKDGFWWRLLLNRAILPLRSRRKARDYKKIWNNKKNESPLKTITRSQAEKLSGILEPLGKHVAVDWAMRYGHPSIASRLKALVDRGCDRILVMPLYPQYAAATTATACDEVFRYLMTLRRQPAVRILPAYYDDPYYIEALASSLKAELKALPFQTDVIVASYHGLPKEHVNKGDPYDSHCAKTTELLREQLKFDEEKLIMTFQSRFGRDEWLQPYTVKTVKKLANSGVKNVVMIMPGFSADCLETLEEIAVENARVFRRAGGKNFAVIPCLNDSEAGMLMIWQLAMRELKGWV